MIVNPVKESKVTFGARLLLYCYNFYSPFGFSQLYLTRFYFSKLIQMIVDMEAEFQNVDSFFLWMYSSCPDSLGSVPASFSGKMQFLVPY